MADRVVYFEMTRFWLVIAGVTTLTAAAPSFASTDDRARYSMGVSSAFGSSDVGEAHGTDVGVGLIGQLKLGTFHLSAELEWHRANLGEEATTGSQASRAVKVRALAHLPLLYIDFKYDLGIALTAGVGAESISFAQPTPQRASVRRDFLTWGFDTVGGIKTIAVGGSRFDIDVGIRIDLARAPRVQSKVRLPSCTGPCNSPTLTAPIDTAFSVALKLKWGPRS